MDFTSLTQMLTSMSSSFTSNAAVGGKGVAIASNTNPTPRDRLTGGGDAATCSISSSAESDDSVAVAELVVWDAISDLGSNILCVLFMQQDHRTI